MRFQLKLSLCLFFLFFLLNCKPNPNIVSLNGEWEYTAGHHPDPKTWDKLEWKKIQVPFNHLTDASNDGWITLKRTLPREAQAFFVGDMPIAFRSDIPFNDQVEFYINGKLFFRNGSITKSALANSVLVNLPDSVKKSETPIIFSAIFYKDADNPYWSWSHLSNKIGLSKEIFLEYYTSEIISFSLLSIYLLSGLYHLLLFFKRRIDLHNLLFGMFCLTISFYWFCRIPSREILFQSNGFLEFKTEISLVFIIPFFIITFLSQIIEGKINLLTKLCSYWSLLTILGGIIAPNLSYLHKILFIWQISMIPFFIYALGYVFYFAFKKNNTAIRILAGMVFMVAGGFYDIFAGLGFFPHVSAMQYCFPIFILNIAVILANKYVKAFNESDRLNEELSHKNESLARADKMKDEFLANTSHELRTPLNGIIGLAESNFFEPTNTLQIQKNSEMIISSGRRLSSLVNDILDFSKLKNAEIELKKQAVDTRKIAELVTSLSTPLAKARGLFLSMDIPEDLPLANADEDRLQQILINLIGNGIKFTHEGGVTIKANRIDNAIQISVQDTGIGIPKEKQSIIFESFEQADGSIGREYGGTGLGLSIVRSLVRLHGSEVTVESEIGKGSTFSFHLPLADSSVRLHSGNESSVKSGLLEFSSVEGNIRSLSEVEVTDSNNLSKKTFQNFTVLVVDDEPINVMVLENHLKAVGLQVETASDGFQALEKMKTIHPQCILLDLMMPRMSGLEVLRAVRESYPPTILPIVILSAKNQVNDLVIALEAGANDYLTKPFSRNELLARLQVHLDLQTSVREQIKQSNSFERFVPSKFINLLDKQSVTDVELGDAKLKNMSVLFTDIRSFTTLSEQMSAEDNFKFLNSYLKRMEPTITNQGGFVDKFIGDAVMALFEEHSNDSSADRALSAAMEMRRSLAEFNIHRAKSGYTPIDIGIGINFGSLVLGTVGSSNRLSTTVIGNTVNLAARLETLTAFYKSGILISDHVVKALKKLTETGMREIGSVQVKGKKEAVGIFEVYETDRVDIAELKEKTKSLLMQGIIQFKIGEFITAIELFQEMLSIYPEDIVAKTYLSRCKELANSPIPENWQGIIEFSHK
jgi:two-component system sensor histidine kinase ChiS